MHEYAIIGGIAVLVSAPLFLLIRRFVLAFVISVLAADVTVCIWWIWGFDEPSLFVLAYLGLFAPMIIAPVSAVTGTIVHVLASRRN